MDLREMFLNEVNSKMSQVFDGDDLFTIKNTITRCLEKYELSERSTEVGFHDDSSERLLQLYAGTLLTEGKSKKTVKGYIYFLKRFIRDVNKNFVDVSTMDIRIWLAKMQEYVSLRSCENYRAYLSAFYIWLATEEYIDKNPMLKIKPIKYTDKIKEAFSDIELDAMRMTQVSIRDRAILELLVSSGIRVSELSALDIRDIDFGNKSVLVREGKGGKQRTTYINDVCVLYLKKYLKTREDSDPSLFMSRLGSRMTARSVEDVLKKIGKESSVDNVHPHRCRRTFATTMYRKGMDIHSIQKLLGHSDINTTIGYIKSEQFLIDAEYRKYA